MPAPSRPARSHQKFVAFSVVGVAMVCLPLLQVLNYQQAELEELQTQRQLLDPVAAAVNTQWALLDHRSLSAAVLGGNSAMESTRQRAKVEVDDRLLSLSSVLNNGSWRLAMSESQALQQDWLKLAGSIQAQALTPTQSDEGHNLRIEQTLQVIDLVTGSLAIEPEIGQLHHSSFVDSARQLSQVARSFNANPQHPLVTEQALERALARAVAGPATPALQAQLQQAVNASQDFQRLWLQAQSAGSDRGNDGGAVQLSTQLLDALQLATLQQRRLLSTLQVHHREVLWGQTSKVQAQRELMLASLLVLGLMATGLGLSLLRPIMQADALAESDNEEIGLWFRAQAQAESEFGNDLDGIDSSYTDVNNASETAIGQAPQRRPASASQQQTQGLMGRLRRTELQSASDSSVD